MLALGLGACGNYELSGQSTCEDYNNATQESQVRFVRKNFDRRHR